ncbi:hypothetical protein tinsulaeT_21010 [Thalassotalea insulae]|uniref:OmpR/PhoB-type domain-containing protein n=1 Tax=Thalassotalea insulae TaxID=2056778 RepID=A0ABQ6GS43_9GAMM|nr:winged helix-turn-helix domain-containing protein [Thalassotalea insulae]GLX78761.1 hypothetical protein tinsulaeT_21010 [Thalassotalea insulae]
MTSYSLNQLSEKPFFLNQCCIDASRNTINKNKDVQSIEPKVMQLLLVLVVNNGQVVSQEQLFSLVWPESIFSPGSIRRAIALLRKAFLECGEPDIITTYPKQGYALNANIKTTDTQITNKKNLAVLLGIAVTILLIFIMFWLQPSSTTYVVKSVVPITATNELEFKAKVSPNGKQLAFLRTSSNAERMLWIKELNNTNREDQLISGAVDEFTWSLDSKSLIFQYKEHSKQLSQINLDTQVINHISFPAHITRISSLQMGQLHQVYFLAKDDTDITEEHIGSTHLVSVNLLTGELTKIKHFSSSYKPYEISINKKGDIIALAGFNGVGKTEIHAIELSNVSGAKSLQSRIIATLKVNRYFLSWHPNNQQLVLSDGRALSILALTGDVHEINYNSYDFVQHPQFSISGDEIIFSYAKHDIDISLLSRNSLNETIELANSNTVDRAGILSPDLKQLAFISHRKGYPQVFVHDIDSGRLTLVYENHQQWLGISQPVWHSNSEKLAFSNYDFPIVVNFEKGTVHTKQYTHSLGVVSDFYSDGEHVLVTSRSTDKLYKIRLSDESLIDHFNTKAKTPLLVNDNVCFPKQTALVCEIDGVETKVKEFQQNIRDWHKSGDDIIVSLTYKTLALEPKTLSLEQTINIRDKSLDVTGVLNDQWLIAESINTEKDIISLMLDKQ